MTDFVIYINKYKIENKNELWSELCKKITEYSEKYIKWKCKRQKIRILTEKVTLKWNISFNFIIFISVDWGNYNIIARSQF